MNRKEFYIKLKDNGLFKAITQSQVDGIEAVLNEWQANAYTDIRWLAYELATIYHETAKTMQPVKEKGGLAYLKSKSYYPYYGRDLLQTTWLQNYKKVKAFTGIDVVTNPDLIADLNTSAKVALHFMVNGLYTGVGLGKFFNARRNDPINARKIINGTDKAELIAGHYDRFLSALT